MKKLLNTFQKFLAPSTAPSTGDLNICFLNDYLLVLNSWSKVNNANILKARLIILKKNPTKNTIKLSTPSANDFPTALISFFLIN